MVPGGDIRCLPPMSMSTELLQEVVDGCCMLRGYGDLLCYNLLHKQHTCCSFPNPLQGTLR